jgi:apolipoprotein N-acyltransferase
LRSSYCVRRIATQNRNTLYAIRITQYELRNTKMNKNLKWGGVAASALLIFFCGLRMMQLPLWEWWSFGLQIGLWGLVICLFEGKYNPRWLGLSALSGVLLAAGFPPMPLNFTIFFAFVPLFFVIYEIWQAKIQAQSTPSVKFKTNLFRYVFNTLIIWNIGATWWVANAGATEGIFAGMVAGLIANYLNSVFMTVVVVLAFRTAWILRGGILSKISDKLGLGDFVFPLVFVPFWLGFEMLHLNWEISWPWLTLGNALADKIYLIQWYDTLGTLGGSAWLLIINVLVFAARFAVVKNGQTNRRLQAVGLAVLLVPMAISVAQYIYWGGKLDTGKTAEVVSLQPNYEPLHEKFEIPETVQMPKMFRQSAAVLDSTVDYLVFPETSFNLRNVDEWKSNSMVFELKDFVNHYPKLNLVLGVDALKIYALFSFEKPQGLPKTVREYANRDGTTTYWEAYNAATQISAGGSDPLPLYKKSKLVPGPEILPYGSFFAFLKPIFSKYGGTVGGLGYQTERSVFVNQDGSKKVAPVICYESIYGDYCRGYVHKGAQALFVVTNDGWWGNTPGYRQHRAYARMRAIELRRSVVRSANTGSSCFINQRGDVEQAADYGVEAAIRSTIALSDELTFYTKMGDLVGWLAVGLFVLLSGLALFKRFFGKK